MQVEIKTTKEQQDTGMLQKAADFVNAFVLGMPFALRPVQVLCGPCRSRNDWMLNVNTAKLNHGIAAAGLGCSQLYEKTREKAMFESATELHL